MIENNPIQYMLVDLQGRYNKLMSDFDKLKFFQKKIEMLRERAANDIGAREVLCRLDAVFPNGLAEEKYKMMACISQMKIQFKQLETQLRNINSDQGVM
ncbi:chromosome partitioning protein ParA [Yersinia aleksiciae]|uniref:Chromosome partitioning protein ParA n=1 Tax=Yersinia aleksiciae TaxID=263819 RepID=A0ABM5UHP6_YERAE|nr:chromosome partitioning protein ParA [Yersinia aleksiciae]AKP35389.1 chromosome partitioning protein ParA [Yersinia aleksiciae]CFQ55863.1 Chromosome segregation ATPase [Yersinia aleksiciae]